MTGGVIVTKESDEVGGILLMICTITGDEEPCGHPKPPVLIATSQPI